MAHVFVMWLHLVAAAVWIGAMVFASLVLRPVVVQGPSSSKGLGEGLGLLHRIQIRFRAVRWLSIVTLFITGFWNLLYEGGSARLESTWGGILLIKLLLAAITIGVAAVQDFFLSPSVSITAAGLPSRTGFWLSNGVLLLSLLVVWVAVYMSQF